MPLRRGSAVAETMAERIPTVVVGATGYVGGELLRLIAGHPALDLAAAVSTSRAGASIAALFPGLRPAVGETTFVSADAAFDDIGDDAGLAIFSAAPHGASAEVVGGLLEAAGDSREVHIVDVSADFRYPDADLFAEVYGQAHSAPGLLDDFHCAVPEHLASADRPHVGHPGCFATAVLLAAVPLYRSGITADPLFVTGITGSTGSGRTPSAGTHHPERHSNLYAYKPLAHRHVPEITALIERASGVRPQVNFIPHSGPFARGIYVTAQTRLRQRTSTADVRDRLREFYTASPFVQIVDGTPRLKDVVASNYCQLGAAVEGDTLAVFCAIDNLVKGAAGGAMQWMNRLWSLPEDAGLTALPPAWT
jgi:N-acetyl-gamma-glutamyl-phosphate reductase